MKCEWADNLYIVRKDGMPHDQRYSGETTQYQLVCPNHFQLMRKC